MKEERLWPLYKELIEKKTFQERIDKAYKILENCILCPRNCKVNRMKGEKGYCGADENMIVSSSGPHYGEESPLVGRGGSGTIFLAHCNLKCNFCQNYDISHHSRGMKTTPEELALIMMDLEREGCHNINFVTPTHYLPQIIKGIKIGAEKGLSIPIVWNCGGYERADMLKLLHGIVDIYMPDFKFWDEEIALKLVKTKDYRDRTIEAFKEMHRQVGDLKIDKNGLARGGMLIRHLVLPDNMAGTREVMRFIAKEISTSSYVNIMDQYRPCFEATTVKGMDRRPTGEEYKRAVKEAQEEGIKRLDRREDRTGWIRILFEN
ncbi:MAG TPA: radical SAM protein [Candidatus Eremiobacteraeota bacterium]|nr:MAG: Radical SAM superfamily protein [bacterium ADurb.Bin363]HPZ06991.1 radical SAM protein [Candidatus Eremiobacteraeota bacterium]